MATCFIYLFLNMLYNIGTTGGGTLYLMTGEPLQRSLTERLQAFLHACGIEYDPCVQFTALLMEADEILATGSMDGAVIKCVAVSPAHQGEDLTGQIMTVLLQRAAEKGLRHLMLYTKPRNQHLFTAFGFHPVIRTADVLLMENQRGGLDSFLAGLTKPADDRGPVGCIVANANPFTLGHRYLAEQAATECAWVHLFILSEDRGMFSPEARLAMAEAACRDLPNVLIHPSGPYMVSAATFPSYFLKDKVQAEDAHCELDVQLFGEKIAPALGVTRRYVGTEPDCHVTARYNQQMKRLLPEYGIELIEVPRRMAADGAISASRVRELIRQGRTDELTALLPEEVIKTIHRT